MHLAIFKEIVAQHGGQVYVEKISRRILPLGSYTLKTSHKQTKATQNRVRRLINFTAHESKIQRLLMLFFLLR